MNGINPPGGRADIGRGDGENSAAKDKADQNSVLILTTDSDFYQYIKNANPNQARISSTP